MKDVKAVAQKDAEVWKGSPYYADAEQWIHVFWGENSPFLTLFQRLDLERLVELACGHGRHGEMIGRRYDSLVRSLVCMDVLSDNIEFSRERLRPFPKIRVELNDGVAFNGIADASVTGVFCYDAMVHFHADVVGAYLADTHRILKAGGRALFHYSNYAENPDRHFGQNPHARAYMTPAIFRTLADEAGLVILEDQTIDWGGMPALDRVTLLEKT
jgi:SAM-dependent methyltransferase